MKKTATAPNEIFNEAMDTFFGFNPVNPYWFLLVLYLRKKHLLSIEPNYPGDSINALTPFNDPSYWDEIVNYHFPEGIFWKTVVGKLDDNERLITILKEFENASKSRNEARFEMPLRLENLYQWEDSFLLSTAERLLEIDDDWFDKNFYNCFDRALHRIFAKERFEMYSQPTELTELVGKICHRMNESIKTVYNPFAGIGSYGLIPNSGRYIGEELNPLIAAIANLRIMASDINGEVAVRDSINIEDYNADIIISTPPFILPVYGIQLNELFGGQNDADTLLMRKCAMCDMCGIIVAPIGISYRADYSKCVRELLIERDCLDMVIELPSNILEGTAITIAVYVINPNHNHKGTIRIINASECFSKGKSKNRLNVDEVINIIDSETPNALFVDRQTLADNDYTLTFNRYAKIELDLPEGSILMPMSELGTIFVERTSRSVDVGKFATFSRLTNPNKLKIFTPEDFETKELPPATNQFSKNCIIVSGARGLRAYYIQTNGEMLYVPAGYFCFIPNEKVVLPLYLVLQLHSDLVQKQVGDRAIASFRRDEFNRLQIVIPPLDEQRKAIEEYKTSLIVELGVEVDSLKTQRFNEYERNMRLRKHALNQILNDVVPATRIISNFISSQDGSFTKDDIVVKRSNSTLDTYTHKLLKNVIKVQDLVAVLTDKEIYYEPEVVDMRSFLEEYEQTKLTDKYQLSSHCYVCFFSDSDDPNDIIAAEQQKLPLTAYVSPKNLTTIFDNIITNAVKHGFTDKKRKDYVIRINYANVIFEGKEMLEIRILNNGNKLPDGMTAEKVFSWGVGSGTGLGSWQTKNIVEHFGGHIEFIQHDDNADGFNIEYYIILPMND